MTKPKVQTISELHEFLQENMATKSDIGAVVARIDNIERNFVRNDVFADFRDKTYTKLDKIIGKLDARGIEDVAAESGLKRAEENIERHDKKIEANRQDIDQLKFHLKTA